MSRCKPQTRLYRICGQALSTDKLLTSLVSFEWEPGFMDSVINRRSSHVLDDQRSGDMQLPEGPGNPELAADRVSGAKTMQ